LFQLERLVVPSLTFPGIAGITFDAAGDVFVSHDSTTVFSDQQQSVAEFGGDGFLLSASVFATTGASAFPGALIAVGSSTSLPNIDSSTDILELQPDGQLFVFDPVSGASSQYDNLPSYLANAANVFDVRTGAAVNLSSQISLTGATYGDFGVYNNSLVVAAESNNWDFVMRLTYGSSGGVATVLVASPASDGVGASPEGVAVDSQGTVLTTLPYVPAGSSSAIDVPVGFSLFYDAGSSPAPVVPTLGLTSIPDIDSGGITVDSQNNFILAATNSSLYGGGPGIVHINSALTAFLADPTPDTTAIPSAITYQRVGGKDYLAFTDTNSDTYTVGGEIPLFSGQVTPAQLRHAYGIDQISFTAPGGATVTGDGVGQTIAIVEEGVDPTLVADLNTYDQFFGIPAPPSIQVVDQNGVTTQNAAIVGEASLDVEWAHAVAPGASIIVYNSAYDPNNATLSFQNLLAAMQQASRLPGVSVVTLSYGEPESSLAASGLNEQSLDSYFTTPGVTFLAASGDSGIYGVGGFQVAANYPAASPDVVSVGGTSIVIDSGGNYPGNGPSGEVAWGSGTNSGIAGGGGGLSAVEPEPTWQSGAVPAGIDSADARALPDVSMDSGSSQHYDVFTSTLSGSTVSASAVGWLGDAGTSAAAPIWAGLIAIADQGRALAGGTPLTGYDQTLPALYSLPATDFHDILYGNNGDPAGPGYDLASGLGTPIANLLVPALAGYKIGSLAPATLSISNLSFTYDGSSHTAVVTTNPPGLSGVTITYTQNGVAVTSPTHAGDYTVTATLNNPNYTAPVATATLVIDQATPTLTWSDPANITAGTRLSAAQLDASASFDGAPLPGELTYTPPAGTVLPAGNGQTVMVNFMPADATDFKAASTSVTINVTQQSTSTPRQAMVISEESLFQRKHRTHSNPAGVEVLAGFTLKFNMSLSAAAASDQANYELDTVTFKMVNKNRVRVLHPLKNFTVTYTPATDSVTLKLGRAQSFKSGGQLTVLPGVTRASDSVLTGTTVFTITPDGRTIQPA
jgi:hypothetical protein